MTEPTDVQLNSLNASGQSLNQIADHFGLSKGTVQGRIYRYRKAVADDNAALKACKFIDAGELDYDIHEQTGVPMKDIAELRKELSNCQHGSVG